MGVGSKRTRQLSLILTLNAVVKNWNQEATHSHQKENYVATHSYEASPYYQKREATHSYHLVSFIAVARLFNQGLRNPQEHYRALP